MTSKAAGVTFFFFKKILHCGISWFCGTEESIHLFSQKHTFFFEHDFLSLAALEGSVSLLMLLLNY